MSGLSIISRNGDALPERDSVLGAINPLGTFRTESQRSGPTMLATSYPGSAPSNDKRFYEDGEIIGMFAGDIVNTDLLDWADVARTLHDDSKLIALLKRLQGSFVLAVYDLRDQVLRVATDSFAFQPLYFQAGGDAVTFSTSIGTFSQLADGNCNHSADWVYQYLFFNYPAGNISPLENVHRVPAGTLGKYSAKSGVLNWIQYENPVSRGSKTINDQDAIDRAGDVFGSVVPAWFDTNGRIVFGLSGGLDCRAVLASLPDSILSQVETFTFGIPGSTEVVEARQIAEALGLHHNEIPLDEEFIQELPQQMHDVVFLSDGLQVINRSHLVGAYRALGSGERGCSTIVTGVSGDHLFRDHISAWGNVPYLISADMASMFRDGRKRLDSAGYIAMFGSRFADFEQHIEHALDLLEQEYGELTDPEAYFRYLMYVAGPKYFGGQAAIANSYSTFRTPYWDRELVQFSMDVELGTVGFSGQLSSKDKYREAALQASVVARNQSFRNLPYLNLPVDVFAQRNPLQFQLHRLGRKLKSVVSGRTHMKEENWPLWYQTALSEEVNQLLGKDSLIREYLSAEFVNQQIEQTNIHWLGKMVTAEIVLRLIDNGWQQSQRRISSLSRGQLSPITHLQRKNA
ncbi:MAG: asparagine synthase-related protein [Woeseiaceae bacterium]